MLLRSASRFCSVASLSLSRYFNYPGLAKLMVDGVSTRDVPLVQACAMIFCAGYLLLVLLADIATILSNPRLRYR